MLSDDALEKLMQPIIDRQENINTYIIELIARRVREIGELSPSDLYKLERLLKMGGDVRKINSELARLTNLQVKDIKKLIRTVAQNSYYDVKPYYDYRHLSYIPFEQNRDLQKVVSAVSAYTADTYKNLSKSQLTGFVIRDLKHPQRLIMYPTDRTYQTVIDEAVQAVNSGVMDYNSAMRRTMEQLNTSGLRARWDSGRTERLDSAVRRNILDGVRAVNQGVQDVVGKQFGADGKELTVHLNSAPDHEPVQGHQFTNEEYNKLQSNRSFEDVNGMKFSPIARAIGTLNCRHFAYSIIIGVNKPVYTQEQLDAMIKKNHDGYTLPSGKHLTLYECSQYQRQLETKIRYARDGVQMAKEAGDEILKRNYETKVSKYLKQYQTFSKNAGLRMKTARI